MTPLISVVIPTFRRPHLLQRCLNALGKQTFAHDAFEVLVVDDGNELATADIVDAATEATGLTIRYLRQVQRRGPAAARNRGWQAAEGCIIAFTDDDCIPQPGWLAAANEGFEAGATVLTGRVIMPLPNQPTAHDRTTALLQSAEFVTANCFCMRSALERVGGFDESFDMAWREDSALQFALLEAGISIEPCPDAVIVHPLEPTGWQAPMRNERKNQYDALLYKRYPHLFRERIPQYRGLVATYYGAVGSAILAAGGAAVGNRALMRAGGLSWLALTALLTARRQAGQPADQLPRNALVSAVTPFLSVYWRLYGSAKHRVWFW
ncbi:glycosyltransferase family 2 protein [Rudanella lutea]|uniref:glycosyltransferase family 2 protein n=1 Tax=Rudanella lutea TaxID=451374 RepID=UPI0003A88652|nr:glycosyltransferase [Rudanella lutea]